MAADTRVMLTVLVSRVVAMSFRQKAWGAFRYQVLPSYDFAPIAANLKTEHA
jgi:hypothetical protein